MKNLKNNRWVVGLIIVLVIIGFVVWRDMKVPANTLISIKSSSVWNPSNNDLITKWQKCESIECNLAIMKNDNASLEARNFVKLITEKGYLSKFEEKGKVDLGMVVFPDRVNENEEYYLLNGFPITISTYVDENSLTTDGGSPGSAIKIDSLYSEMKEKYSQIELLGDAKEFVEKKSISDNTDEYVFKYGFVNGCHACNTEYSAKIGFDFTIEGEYISTKFIQIEKENK